jgi:enoyl-CoA hydratase
MAVHGITFTIGIEMLLAADIRVASADTRFGQLEIAHGLYPLGGATFRLVREAGWGNANVLDDMPAILASDDFREGVASFRERRPAIFTGR